MLELLTLRARRVVPSLKIEGTDILQGLESENIITFKYTDCTSDKADDLCITVADPHRTWMKKYSPKTKKGTECTASFEVQEWMAPRDNRTLDCGIFFINEVHFKGPPNEISIKASSIPPTGAKDTKNFKAWENMDLRGIAGEIASKHGLTLTYDTIENPKTKRTDQTDKSDFEYLRDRCKEAKLSMKVHKKQLVIYSEEEYEAREPAFTLIYGESNILDWDFVSKNDDTYVKACNAYIDPDTGLLVEDCFEPEEKPEGTKAKMNVNEAVEMEPDDGLHLWDSSIPPAKKGRGRALEERVTPPIGSGRGLHLWDTSVAEKKGKGKGGKKGSKRKAKAKLREKNKKEKKSKLKVVGNIDYLSGLNCMLKDFGEAFDIKWFIESSCHEISGGGYTTDLGLRCTLKGY